MMKSINKLYDKYGNYITDDKYQEILKLDVILTKAKIPHTREKFLDGWQIIYPEDGEKRIADVVQCFGSYGNEDDLLEIMGLLTQEELKYDSVVGYLTAEKVFDRIISDWEMSKEK